MPHALPDSGVLRSPLFCVSGGHGYIPYRSPPSLPVVLQEDRDIVEETVRGGLK